MNSLTSGVKEQEESPRIPEERNGRGGSSNIGYRSACERSTPLAQQEKRGADNSQRGRSDSKVSGRSRDHRDRSVGSI